jgi:RNA polymerase sigma-70 factor (ECF subfamily)
MPGSESALWLIVSIEGRGKFMLAITEYAHEVRTTEPARSRSDAALLKAVAGKDRGAMLVLYARHHARVYRFLLRLTNDTPLAEELVSDVFFAVWHDAAKFADKSEVSTWMLAIARHKAFSALKRRPHERLTDEIVNSIVDPAESVEVMIERGDRRAAIQACLRRLSPDHREVIDLVYYHEKTVEEVAEITGVPKNTVKTRMFYARKYLAKLLKTTGYAEKAQLGTIH